MDRTTNFPITGSFQIHYLLLWLTRIWNHEHESQMADGVKKRKEKKWQFDVAQKLLQNRQPVHSCNVSGGLAKKPVNAQEQDSFASSRSVCYQVDVFCFIKSEVILHNVYVHGQKLSQLFWYAMLTLD